MKRQAICAASLGFTLAAACTPAHAPTQTELTGAPVAAPPSASAPASGRAPASAPTSPLRLPDINHPEDDVDPDAPVPELRAPPPIPPPATRHVGKLRQP